MMMKRQISLFLICFFVAICSVNGPKASAQTTNASNQTVNLSVSNAKVESVIDQIEKQTKYLFVYNKSLVNVDRIVSLNLKNATIEQALSTLFKNSDVTYTVKGQQVLLAQKAAATTNTTVSGKITDKTSVPLPGVSILVQGTTNGTTTDIDGNYSLSNIPAGSTLEYRFIGMQNIDVIWKGQSAINLQMTESTESLEDVVVIAYGTVKKKDLTGAVDVIGDKVLTRQSNGMVSQQLQGTMPGVTVTRSSSQPGAGASIKIRGITTMSSNSPLIIVDGITVDSINDVNSNDVDQITVLKDAASASIYGSRAAAGVILITTKSAKPGQVNISYNGEFSFQEPTRVPSSVGAIDYMKMINEAQWNDVNNIEGSEYAQYPKDYIDTYMANNLKDPISYPNTNWRSQMVDAYSPRQKHSLVFTYGNKVVNTRASFSYEYNEGIYDEDTYERIMGRVRNNIKFSDKWSADVDVAFKRSHMNTENASDSYMYTYMTPAIYAATYPDGRVAEGQTYTNPYAALKYGGFVRTINSVINGKIALNFKPVKDLTITAALAPTYNMTQGKSFKKSISVYDAFEPSQFVRYIKNYESPSLTESRTEVTELTKQLIATYDKSFADKHNMNLMAGYEDYSYKKESLSANSQGMELNNFPYLDLANNNNLAVGGSAYRTTYESFFGRAMYNYQNRYYAQANFRADGSSRFHKDHRWGYFPSASVGWVISNENFMKNISWLNHLKLRGSFGSLGNERIGNYPYQANIAFNNAAMWDASGSNVVTSMSGAQIDYAIQNISWETTYTWDVGLDAEFFKNRLSLTGDYYHKETKDMLLALAIPAFTGYAEPDQNAGKMHTNGWEVKLSWRDRIGDIGYGASFNISDYKSVMGDLSGKESLGSHIIREGEEYNAWYGYVSDGIFQTQEEVDAGPVMFANQKPGDIRYKDLSGPDGVPDGKIDATYDRTTLGGSLPRYNFGGTLNFDYKNLSIAVMFDGVGKRKVLMSEYMMRPFMNKWLAPSSNLLGDYWSTYNTAEQNANAFYPRLGENSMKSNYEAMTDYWLIDGSYFRLKNVNIGYNLPAKWLKKVSIDNLRLYVSLQDLFSIDHFPDGWDPEASYNGYIARSYTFGIDLKF